MNETKPEPSEPQNPFKAGDLVVPEPSFGWKGGPRVVRGVCGQLVTLETEGSAPFGVSDTWHHANLERYAPTLQDLSKKYGLPETLFVRRDGPCFEGASSEAGIRDEAGETEGVGVYVLKRVGKVECSTRFVDEQ